MKFQHPELLYALLLLIIPLIVHLFRLRRFQKEDFTNVKFLKKVIQETRKSSRLKKFLVLFTRMLMLACIIIAFAQPYIPAASKASEEVQRLVYLDNSFSMQSPLNDVSLLRDAANRLYENIQEESKFDLMTNDRNFFDLSASDLKTKLQDIDFTQETTNFRQLKLKAENYFRKYPGARKELVIISDFQQNMELPAQLPADSTSYIFIPENSAQIFNSSIDTAYITGSDPENLQLKIELLVNTTADEDIAVSVYDGERLLGRNTVNFSEEKTAEIEFSLQNEKIADGIIKIEDSGLLYDNELYFNISEKQPVKVVVISEAPAGFLQKIYSEPEFELSVFAPDNIDFNTLNSANLVILNEVKTLTSSLLTNLTNIHQNQTGLVIIPPANPGNYNSLLNSLGFSSLGPLQDSEKLISEIEFDHPLLKGVFEDRVENFEYSKVSRSYQLSSGNAVLRFADGQAFLSGANSAYLFAAPLNRDNSNFLSSPLVVTVFYQFGLQSFKNNQLYYLSNTENSLDVPIKMESDHVLHLVKEDVDFIPQQQNFSNHVRLNITSEDLSAGNYKLMNKGGEAGILSFNYSREESDLTKVALENIENVTIAENIDAYFSKAIASSHITMLWKWFVIFALIFLAIEMLLLKFLK